MYGQGFALLGDVMQWQGDAWLGKGYSIVLHCKESKGSGGVLLGGA